MSQIIKPRPLGADQTFWWLIDQNHPVHLALVAEVAGPTTIEGWRTALREIRRRHPNLSGRITKDENGNLWFCHLAGASIPLHVVQGDPSDWTSELKRELVTRFDLSEAPLARATLIHQPDRSTLILAMHHSIADAKSTLFAIRDVLLVLSGQPVALLKPIPSLTGFLYGGPMGSQVDGSEENPLPSTDAKADLYRSFDGEIPSVARLTLAHRLTAELRNRCRQEGVTVNSALVSAAIMAAREISGQLRDAPITIISPSDMRSLLGAGDDVAPLAGGATLTMEASKQPKSFWQLARIVKASLIPPRTLEELSRSFAPIQKLMSRQPSLHETIGFLASNGGHKISINNLGLVPFEPVFGAVTLEALWGPAILLGYEGERLISAATVNGSLNLLHTSYDPIPSILDVMQQRMAAACAR
jgi:NRPS condensation-like uncharacterized protein